MIYVVVQWTGDEYVAVSVVCVSGCERVLMSDLDWWCVSVEQHPMTSVFVHVCILHSQV